MREKYQDLIFAVFPGLLAGILLILVGHQPNDDAYITFKHSRNLAEYNQFVWNIYDSEKTLGSSTPFFAFLLGILGKISPENIPDISLFVNAVVLAGIGFIIYKISYRFIKSNLLSFCISFVISINSFNIRIYSYGFEFALFTFLVLLNIDLLFNAKNQNQKILALLLSNFVILTRIEGVFLYPLVLIMLWKWYKSHLFRKYYLLLPFLFLFYAIFASFYYQQFLPQSIYAKKVEKEYRPLIPPPKNLEEFLKQKIFLLEQLWGSAFSPIIRFGTEQTTLMQKQFPYQAGTFLLNSNKSLLYYSIFIMIFIIYKYYKEKKLLNLYYFLYFPFFALFVSFTIRVESWYFPPAITSYLLFLFIGTVEFFYFLENKIHNYKLKISNYLSLIFILLFAGKNFYIINQGKYSFDEHRGIIYPPAFRDHVEYERYLAYKDTVEFLHKNNYSGEIATPEVGVIGFYYKNGTVLDLFGLCSKRVTDSIIEYYTKKIRQPFIEFILEKYRSEILIYFYHPEEKNLQEYLNQNYNLSYTHPEYTIFSHPLQVWIRKSTFK